MLFLVDLQRSGIFLCLRVVVCRLGRLCLVLGQGPKMAFGLGRSVNAQACMARWHELAQLRIFGTLLFCLRVLRESKQVGVVLNFAVYTVASSETLYVNRCVSWSPDLVQVLQGAETLKRSRLKRLNPKPKLQKPHHEVPSQPKPSRDEPGWSRRSPLHRLQGLG